MLPKTSSASTPRIAAIAPTQGLRVLVTWGAGPRSGKTEELNLSPILNSMKFFRPLRKNPDLFATIHTVDYGTAVAWGDDEEIDLSAGALLRLAEETMSPEDMRAFIASHGLTETSLAAILDYSRRQIVGFINEGRRIPRVVSLACRYIEHTSATVSRAPDRELQSRIAVPQGFVAEGRMSIPAATETDTDITSLGIIRVASLTGTSSPPQTTTDEQLLNAA